jgi:hypothetical protein
MATKMKVTISLNKETVETIAKYHAYRTKHALGGYTPNTSKLLDKAVNDLLRALRDDERSIGGKPTW